MLINTEISERKQVPPDHNCKQICEAKLNQVIRAIDGKDYGNKHDEIDQFDQKETCPANSQPGTQQREQSSL